MQRPIEVKRHFYISGEYRFEAVQNGVSRWLTGWFSNNITNVGLDMMATSSSRFDACQVGTGSSAPANDDTTLGNYLAGTSTRGIAQRSVTVDYGQLYLRYDFATGTVVGNVSEVGVGPSASSGQNLFSRELIRDEFGDPTTLSVLATESLRVHYRVRHYVPVDDVLGTVNLGYSPAHDTTRRAANAGVSTNPNWLVANPAGSSVHPIVVGVGMSTSDFRGYTGGLGAATGIPSGASFVPSSVVAAAYSAGSYQRVITATFGTAAGNGNLRSFLFNLGRSGGIGTPGNGGAFQVELDPVVEKDNTKELALEYTVSWSRRP